jgi:hypothetical protein
MPFLVEGSWVCLTYSFWVGATCPWWGACVSLNPLVPNILHYTLNKNKTNYLLGHTVNMYLCFYLCVHSDYCTIMSNPCSAWGVRRCIVLTLYLSRPSRDFPPSLINQNTGIVVHIGIVLKYSQGNDHRVFQPSNKYLFFAKSCQYPMRNLPEDCQYTVTLLKGLSHEIEMGCWWYGWTEHRLDMNLWKF